MTPIENITFAEALEDYICSKDRLLSPSTVRGYRTMQRSSFDRINDLQISELTEKVIQRWVNSLADKYSSKTIRNQVGLLTVVLHQNGINLNMKSITLKPKIKPEYNIPTETEIQKIALAVKHTTIEIPIIIALTLGLRQSEIAGLRWEHYDGTYLKIKCAVVPDENHKLVEKNENKSYAGRRIIEVPDYLKDILDSSEHSSERISPHSPNYIWKHFDRICEENGIPHFTIHSPRHANASAMLKLNIPDKYAMERMGHSTPNMLKQVYQHIFRDEQTKVANKMNDYFNDILK